MGTSGAFTYGASPKTLVERGGDGAGDLRSGPFSLEAVARPWRESVSRSDVLAAVVLGPQIGVDVASVDKGVCCTAAGGSQIAWEAACEENNPAKT